MAENKKKISVLPFPLKGINRNFAESAQPPLTSPAMKNVRPADVMQDRIRGGQRPGLKIKHKVHETSARPVVAINEVTVVEVS